jgi:hypothetical protein
MRLVLQEIGENTIASCGSGKRKSLVDIQQLRTSIEHNRRAHTWWCYCLYNDYVRKVITYLSQNERIFFPTGSETLIFHAEFKTFPYFRVIIFSQSRFQTLGPTIVKGEIRLYTTAL